MNDSEKLTTVQEKPQNKVLSQQIFHPSFFNRPRTQSLSNLDNLQQIDTEQISTDTNQWTEVPVRKRQRESPDNNKTQKQKKLDNYWLSQPTPTSNSFYELDSDPQTTQDKDTTEKPTKAPPLYVDKVGNIQPLLKMLDKIADGNYEVKVLSNEQVRIQPATTELYTKIVKGLQEKNTEFYTYRLKQDRPFKVVLKNLHPSTDIDEIKTEIETHGHKVTNIWNVKQRSTKKPLPIYFVEIEANTNNKLIYDIKTLLHCRIVIEPPRPKREIPQCGNCQQYGHTKKYCFRQPKCIKCAGDHASINCERKGRSDSVKCVLCEGNHPANYKGCSIYKELQKIKYPPQPVKRKQMSHPEHQRGIANTNRPPTGLSYRDILQSNKPSHQPASKASPNESSPSSNSDMKELMNSMTKLMQQLTSVTNLLIEVMTKFTNSVP